MNALQSVVYSFMGEQVPYIEQILRMLAVERSDNLASTKVSEADDRHFGESEFFLHPRSTGVTSTLICASSSRTISLVMPFSPFGALALTRAPGSQRVMASAMRFIASRRSPHGGVLSHTAVIVYGYSLSLELDSRIELLGSCDADSI